MRGEAGRGEGLKRNISVSVDDDVGRTCPGAADWEHVHLLKMRRVALFGTGAGARAETVAIKSCSGLRHHAIWYPTLAEAFPV